MQYDPRYQQGMMGVGVPMGQVPMQMGVPMSQMGSSMGQMPMGQTLQPMAMPLQPHVTGPGGAPMAPMPTGVPGMDNYYWYQQLGCDYNLQPVPYAKSIAPTWGPWDVANAQYCGNHLERSYLEDLVSRVWNGFRDRVAGASGARPKYLREKAAREAHMRVYVKGMGVDAGNRSLGGAAAYQALMIWERYHQPQFQTAHSLADNVERVMALAVAELHNLWEQTRPRSSRAKISEAAEWAAGTAQNLYYMRMDPSIDPTRYDSGSTDFGSDDGRDSPYRRHRPRSTYGGRDYGGRDYGGRDPYGPGMGMGGVPLQPGMQGMQPGMPMQYGVQPGVQLGAGAMGMQPGMAMQPGYQGYQMQPGVAMQPGYQGMQPMVPMQMQGVPMAQPYAYGSGYYQAGVGVGAPGMQTMAPMDQYGYYNGAYDPRSWYGPGRY